MYLLLDIGGTKTRMAQSSDGKTLENIQSFPTPTTVEEFTREIRSKIAATPTVVSAGITRRRRDIAEKLPTLFSCPVYIENDAALAGLAEATAGAGQGVEIVVFLTISTGVGGTRVTAGQIDQSAFGFEPGRQILGLESGEKSLEDLISGRGFAVRFGCSPVEVTDAEVWQEAAQYLALGLHNTMVHWSPEVVILGGKMMLGQPAIDLAEVRRRLAPLLDYYQVRPEIKLAVLGDNSGLLGALIHCCSRSVFSSKMVG